MTSAKPRRGGVSVADHGEERRGRQCFVTKAPCIRPKKKFDASWRVRTAPRTCPSVAIARGAHVRAWLSRGLDRGCADRPQAGGARGGGTAHPRTVRRRGPVSPDRGLGRAGAMLLRLVATARQLCRIHVGNVGRMRGATLPPPRAPRRSSAPGRPSRGTGRRCSATDQIATTTAQTPVACAGRPLPPARPRTTRGEPFDETRCTTPTCMLGRTPLEVEGEAHDGRVGSADLISSSISLSSPAGSLPRPLRRLYAHVCADPNRVGGVQPAVSVPAPDRGGPQLRRSRSPDRSSGEVIGLM